MGTCHFASAIHLVGIVFDVSLTDFFNCVLMVSG